MELLFNVIKIIFYVSTIKVFLKCNKYGECFSTNPQMYPNKNLFNVQIKNNLI